MYGMDLETIVSGGGGSLFMSSSALCSSGSVGFVGRTVASGLGFAGVGAGFSGASCLVWIVSWALIWSNCCWALWNWAVSSVRESSLE